MNLLIKAILGTMLLVTVFSIFLMQDYALCQNEGIVLFKDMTSCTSIDSFLLSHPNFHIPDKRQPANWHSRKNPITSAEGVIVYAGYIGKADVSFYRGRLFSVRFFPDDFDGFRAFYRHYEQHLEKHKRIWESVDYSEDYKAHPYFGYEDVRLADHFKFWLIMHW